MTMHYYLSANGELTDITESVPFQAPHLHSECWAGAQLLKAATDSFYSLRFATDFSTKMLRRLFDAWYLDEERSAMHAAYRRKTRRRHRNRGR